MTSNEEFIKRNKIRVVDGDKNTRLHYVAALGDVDDVKKVLEDEQKIDPENYLGWTPLMMAVRNNNVEVVDFLLENKADATKKNRFGSTVFLMSVAGGNMDIVVKVLTHLLSGGVPRRHLQRTISPISMSIMFSNTQVFRYLLDQSFDVNAPTSLTGITPQMFAAALGNLKAMKRLSQKGADPNIRNSIGRTAADISNIKKIKLDIDLDPSQDKSKSPQVPMIVLTPNPSNMGTSALQLTPLDISNNYPTAIPSHISRKSSNVSTPNSPMYIQDISPISPYHFAHQMFFPQDFLNPVYVNAARSPVEYSNNSALNHAVYLIPSPLPQ